MKSVQLKKWLVVLGSLNLIFVSTRILLSYCLVTIAPLGSEQSNEAQIFNSLAQRFVFLGESFQHLLTGNSIFRGETAFALAGALPGFLSTVVFIVLLVLLTRKQQLIDSDTPLSLFRWSVIFVSISALAVPIMAQDFWLSIAWGQMSASGENPYYADLTSAFTQNLPLDHYNTRMTYGPFWALMSGGLAWLAGGNGLIAAILFKLVLVGAWIGSLFLVRKLLSRYSLQRQCIGLAIFGWLPLSIGEIAAEGHNDIVMVFLLLFWLRSLEQRRTAAATFALAASVLIKYTTAPLFLLEFLYLFYSRRQSLVSFLPVLFASCALMILVFAVFYRSQDFFSAAMEMRNWHFFTPKDAIITLSKLLKAPSWVKYLPQTVFLIAAIYSIIFYLKEKTEEAFRRAVLAVLSAVLFGFIGHIWSWFLLWVLPIAALIPHSVLSRWSVGLALAFPFAILVLQFVALSPYIRWEVSGLVLYAFALFWLVLTSRTPLINQAETNYV